MAALTAVKAIMSTQVGSVFFPELLNEFGAS